MVLAVSGFQKVGFLFDFAFFAYALYSLSERQTAWTILFTCFTTFMVYADVQYIRTGKRVYNFWT